MFFNWYGFRSPEQPGGLLSYLSLFERERNAWQALELIPVLLTLVIVVTIGMALLRLSGLGWEPIAAAGVVVCALGGFAVLLILFRIVFPPDPGIELDGVRAEATLKVGIFLALAAGVGIAYGGYLAMREESISFGDLWASRH